MCKVFVDKTIFPPKKLDLGKKYLQMDDLQWDSFEKADWHGFWGTFLISFIFHYYIWWFLRYISRRSIDYSSNQLLFLKLEGINLLHQRCDTDGDGVLNFQEFKRWASTIILNFLAREKILVSLNHPFCSMMLRNRKRQKLAKMKAEEEERKKPKVIPHWKRAAMEALRQEREKMEKANEEKDNREEADESVEDSEEKPAYFNDFLAQAKRLDSSLKSSCDLDHPVQRQSSEGEDEVEVGEEIERRSLIRERMMRYKEDKYKDKDKDTMMRYKVKESQPHINPYEVLPGYSRNTLGSSISKSKSMSMNVSNMSNMSNLSNMSINMNLSLHQLGMANSRSMVLSQPVVLSPH